MDNATGVTILIFVTTFIGFLMLLVWRTQTNRMKSLRLQLSELKARCGAMHNSVKDMLTSLDLEVERNREVMKPEDDEGFTSRIKELNERLKQFDARILDFDPNSMSGRDLKAAFKELNSSQLLNHLEQLEKEVLCFRTEVAQTVYSSFQELASMKSQIGTLIQSRDELWKRIRTAVSQTEQEISENADILKPEIIRAFIRLISILSNNALHVEELILAYNDVEKLSRAELNEALHQLDDLLIQLQNIAYQAEGVSFAVGIGVDHVWNILQRSSQLNQILFGLWKAETHVMGCELRDELHRRLLAAEQLVPLVQLLVAARDYGQALELLEPLEEDLKKIRQVIEENQRQRERIRDELAKLRRIAVRGSKRPTNGANIELNKIAETVYGYVATHRTLRDTFMEATSDALLAGELGAAEKWLDKTSTAQEAVDRGAKILHRLMQHEENMASIQQAMTEILGEPQPIKLQVVLSMLSQMHEPLQLRALWPTIELIVVELASLITALDAAMMASLLNEELRNDGRKAITGLVHETTQIEAFLALEDVSRWQDTIVPLLKSWHESFLEAIKFWHVLQREQEELFAEKQPANEISQPTQNN